MSTENIRSFFHKAKDNPELQQKIVEIHNAASLSAAGALATLSRQTGHPFSTEELLQAQAQSPLDDDALAGVAGGRISPLMFFAVPLENKPPTQ